jgi:hypothetical protein
MIGKPDAKNSGASASRARQYGSIVGAAVAHQFGPIEIAHRPATAEKVDVTQSDLRYEQDLAENARQYKMATAKKAKRAPQR